LQHQINSYYENIFYGINIKKKRLHHVRFATHDKVAVRSGTSVCHQVLLPHKTTVTKTTISNEKNHFSLGKKIFLN
jgi:hypothetical protein